MKLSKLERANLALKLKILEALYPNEANEYRIRRKALEEGYELHYAWIEDELYDGLNESQCRFVLNVLDMYRSINIGLQNLPEDDSLKNHHLAKFQGFDGNNENEYMSYTRYFILDLDRFDELKQTDFDQFNSHSPMIATYKSMLERLATAKNKHRLSRNDIAHVLGEKL